MNKAKLIKALGGSCEKAAKKLEYSHRQTVQSFAQILTEGQEKAVTRRLKAAGWSKARIAELN